MVEVNIQIQKSDSGYTAYSPEIPDHPIHGESLDSVVNDMKELVRRYLESPTNPLLDLLAEFDEFAANIPPDELARLPVDGAEQHDHYLYRSPKREI